MAIATGATISTVATLSTKAEMSPANSARATTAHFTFGTWDSRISAMRAGICESINNETMPMVPAIIIKTLKFMYETAPVTGSIPVSRKIAAEPKATYLRYLGRHSIRIYVRANKPMARGMFFKSIPPMSRPEAGDYSTHHYIGMSLNLQGKNDFFHAIPETHFPPSLRSFARRGKKYGCPSTFLGKAGGLPHCKTICL